MSGNTRLFAGMVSLLCSLELTCGGTVSQKPVQGDTLTVVVSYPLIRDLYPGYTVIEARWLYATADSEYYELVVRKDSQ